MEYGFLLTSLWLGVLTSVSPCPLTTNITAISYIGQKIDKPYNALLSGLFYTFGRVFVYTVLGVFLSFSFSNIPVVSNFLQTKMPYIIAPTLIIVGLMILGIIKINFFKFGVSENTRKNIEKRGLIGAFLLGGLFALALCPVSAGLFLGNLIETKGNVLSMIMYGIGTGLPVVLVAVVLFLGLNKIAKVYKNITVFEKWARWFTGAIFVIAGFYYFFND